MSVVKDWKCHAGSAKRKPLPWLILYAEFFHEKFFRTMFFMFRESAEYSKWKSIEKVICTNCSSWVSTETRTERTGRHSTTPRRTTRQSDRFFFPIFFIREEAYREFSRVFESLKRCESNKKPRLVIRVSVTVIFIKVVTYQVFERRNRTFYVLFLMFSAPNSLVCPEEKKDPFHPIWNVFTVQPQTCHILIYSFISYRRSG